MIFVYCGVRHDQGMRSGPATEFDPGDPSSIPTIGDYYIGGREATTGEDGRWRFVHGALAEALLGRAQRHGRLRAWNRYAALALARDRTAEPEQLARHQLAARRPAEAAETLLRAFDAALMRADPAGCR